MSESTPPHSISISWGTSPARYLETLVLGPHKLRITLRCETYAKSESYAKIERWDGAQWQELHTLYGDTTGMVTKAEQGILTGDTIQSDREELLRVAGIILTDQQGD